MSRPLHLAVVDDEPDLRSAVARYLGRHGYLTSEAADGAGLDALMAERAIDLVVLDVSMPGEDGFSIARRLRASSRVGIILLTASTEMVDRVVGLELGADDYVAKPCDLRELLARVRSLERRLRETPAAVPALADEVRIGRCVFNRVTGKLFTRAGEPVGLTRMEIDLLRAFASRPGEVLSRETLLDLAHAAPLEAFDRSVDSRITRLRRKLEVDPLAPGAIRTVHGQGYVFSPG